MIGGLPKPLVLHMVLLLLGGSSAQINKNVLIGWYEGFVYLFYKTNKVI